jgi:hypothetical protein
LAQKNGANLPPQRCPPHSSHIWSSKTYGFTSTCRKDKTIHNHLNHVVVILKSQTREDEPEKSFKF